MLVCCPSGRNQDKTGQNRTKGTVWDKMKKWFCPVKLPCLFLQVVDVYRYKHANTTYGTKGQKFRALDAPQKNNIFSGFDSSSERGETVAWLTR